VPRHKLWSDEDESDHQPLRSNPPAYDYSDDPVTGGGDRWSTWDLSRAGERGPKPYPSWLVTELAAVDVERGVLKTGKEADVHLLWRGVPDTDRACLLAAKRYRDAQHRQFHRDAAYQEGRRVRRSREMRAMKTRTAFGRDLLAGQWAWAEFAALRTLWTAGVAVPYPVQIVGTEVLLEFVGDADGVAAPRLAELPDRGGALDPLWDQLVELLVLLARNGLAHGDLSAYNLLVHHGRLVMIDLPQVVDVVANPQGGAFLDRDARNVATWFDRHGRPADPAALVALLRAEARLG
jgi:RIO kinase 1